MAEAKANSTSPSLNGDALLGVTVHDVETNTEFVVLPKNDDLGAGVSENAVKVIRNRFTDDTRVGQAGAACDNNEPAETKVDNGQANFLARSNKDKSGGNTYVVSNDSDDDHNAECITLYRGEVIDVSDNSDSSDSDTSSTVSDDNDDSDNVSTSSSDNSDTNDKRTRKERRTTGELSVKDLPPIEDLKISVDENLCKPVGSILNIVDELVVIQSFPYTPPLDIDTVLFLDRGQRALGKIFDVFGPVQEPFYSVRFNSRKHIQERDIRREQVVYCAPQTDHTSYIPVAQLMKEKGSDASWNDNNEPPETYLDFSDDEAEARQQRQNVHTGSKRDASFDNDLFVKRMNQRNLELTAKRRKEDEARQKRGSAMRKVMTYPGSQPGESPISVAAHSFAPFSKSRTFSNSSSGDLACSSSFFHHPVPSAVMANTHSSSSSKFGSRSAPRPMNYLRNAAAAAAAAAVSYSPGPPPPVNYAFPSPQHFMCSSSRQLPNPPSSTAAVAAAAAATAAATQNYLAMFHHQRPQPVPTGPPTALPMVPSPFSHFTPANVPPMSTFVTQPRPRSQPHQSQQQAALHPAIPPSFNAAVPPPPPPFAAFNPMPTPPLPSSLPQPNFFASRTDASGAPVHHATTFIPLSMRPAVPPTFHPPFVLPPPPPPPPPPVTLPHAQPTQQQHQKDLSTSRVSDRRIQPQPPHQTNNTF